MALPPTASSASSPPSSFSCFTNSVSSLFLSCIQTRRIKKGRHSPNPPTATPNNNNNRASCSHAITARKCTCAYISPADTIAEKEPEALPSLDSNTISITHRTSIRIVESDSSSDYDSRTSLDSDLNSVSDYGCGCGSELPEHDHEPDHGYQQYTYEDDEKLSARPLPPLPSGTTTTITHTALSRKHPEIKTRLIEETIPEEDEDEYLEQQESQSQPEGKDQDPKQSKGATTGSRRKSMIELFNLSSSRSGSATSSPSVASSNPGLSLSFSNLHFRFPLPPAWGQQQQQQQQEHRRDGNEGNQSQDQEGERKRPMSTSALPSSTTPSASSAKKQARGVSLHSALTRSQPVESENTSTTTTTTKQAAVTTKKERRMATIVFPPLARLSRSGMNGNNNRGSTNPASGRSLFS